MGFYYDDQMKNPDITVRLYTWDDSIGDYNETKKGLVATAIMSDDFNVSIHNAWGDNDGGDFIENGFNSLRRLGPVVGDIAKNLSPLLDSNDTYDADLFNWISKGAKAVAGIAGSSKTKEYFNKNLISQTSRFCYYGGTSVSLGGNLMMRYTIFYDPVTNTSVNEKIAELFKYSVGRVENVTEFSGLAKIAGAGDTVVQEVAETVESYYKWQNPPNGFTAALKNIDNRLKGTFKLWFGEMYYIDNLVIEDMNIVMSKLKVKRTNTPGSTDASGRGTESTPLYADVSISLRPAGMILDSTLTRYINARTGTNNAGTNK